MTNLIRLIVVVVVAVAILSFCNLSRRVELITITADNPPPYSAEQVIKIRYVIKNTGSRAVGGTASVTSDKSMVFCPGLNTIGDLDNSLDRNEEIVCTGDYPVKAADIEARAIQVTSSATIGGVVSNPVTVSLPTIPNPLLLSSLKLTTSASPPTYSQAGQPITYNYIIQNVGTGNLGPTQFTVSDNLITTAPFFNCGPGNTTLAPSATVTCTAPYTITQNDMSAVSITNIATAAGGGQAPSPAASTTINKSLINLALTTKTDRSTYSQAGQQVTYTYVITNIQTGNLGPYQFTVKDNLLSATPFNCGPVNTTLAPNTTVTCTAPAPYTVTQNDLSAVSITNIATAYDGAGGSSAPASTTISKSNDRQHKVEKGEWLWQIARCYGVNPHTLVADNQALVPNPRMLQPGTIVTVRNPGSYSEYHGPPCVEPYTVQAGDTWNSIAQKYGADSVILQMANSTRGLSTGTIIYVPRYSASGSSAPPTGVKALALTTAANPTTYDQAGQQITFSYVIRNSGNTTLGPAQFTVSDSLVSAAPFNCGPANTTLASNATVTCNAPAPYAITQNDMTAVSITNIATASGGGAGQSPSASATINKGIRSLSLTTTANPVTYNGAGQTITFTYAIRNSGTVTLGPTQFTISDLLISPTPFNCGVANITLAPNATVTCQVPYVISQNDMSAVSITNIATASGGGTGPSPAASATVNRQ